MYLFYLLILLVPMLALKRRTPADGSILDAKSTTCIKGILCIYVMFHNLGLDLENGVVKERICEYTGGIGVGLFFFLSAFGIVRSYQQKGNRYLGKLILVHIPKLYAVAVFINAITYFSFMKGAFETRDRWMRILNLDLFNKLNGINRHGWYIASILALYLIFAVVYFLCSRLKSEKRMVVAAVIMSLVAIGFRIAAHIADHGGMYTREMPAFAIGILYATFYDEVNSFANKHFGSGMALSIACIVLGFVFWEPLATYASALVIILVSQRFTYYSSVTFFLGKICIGVYLFLHYSSIVMQRFIVNEYFWVLTNAGFILEVAALIYGVEYLLTALVKRLKMALKPKDVEFSKKK